MVSYIGKVRNKKIEIRDSKSYECELEQFISKNEGKFVEVKYEIVNDMISYSTHKYYRKYILPALTEALGELDENGLKISTDEQHYLLKKRFMYRKIDKYDDIPKRCRGKCDVDCIEKEITKIVDNKTVFVKARDYRGYIPSMAVFTKKEAKHFVKECEDLLEWLSEDLVRNDEAKELKKAAGI